MTTQPSQQLLDEVITLTRRLRMPYLRAAAPDVLATAKAQRWDPAEALRVLLEEEARGRDAATIANRRRKAQFPTGKTLESWRPDASSIPAATQQALRTLEWIRRAENLAVVGPSGTGKSHLLEALGNAAIDDGMTVAWFTVETLGQLVRRHRADDTVTKAVKRVLKADLIVIDLCRPRDYADTSQLRFGEAHDRSIRRGWGRRQVGISPWTDGASCLSSEHPLREQEARPWQGHEEGRAHSARTWRHTVQSLWRPATPLDRRGAN